ncbi:MAG: fibronectin type III domain-containing protein, partial [Pseudomonadales bacterium]|nr:fibronectin type III domain-containing protein [Pseudomonadales bacterium]
EPLQVRISAAVPALIAVSATPHSVEVRWRPVPGADTYQIHATEAGANQPSVGPLVAAEAGAAEMSGSLSGLTPGFGYSVWVRANYPDGQFAPSEIREVTLADPVNPDNLQAVREGERGVRLTWNPVPGVAGYRVEGPNVPAGQVQTAFLVVPDLGDGDHRWRVMSVYGRGVYNDVTARSVGLLIESRAAMVERAFNAGQASYPNAGPDPARWKRLALESDLAYERLVASFASIWVVTQAYQYLLERDPGYAEVRTAIEQLDGGRSWREVWRTVAQSNERDQKFGHWAPAPLIDLGQARVTFGQSGLNNGQACFGGLGDGCDSPEVGEPEWDTGFALPDGTRMGFVTVNVAVGSILHDNACLQNRNGLHCDNQAWHWVAEHLPSPLVANAISPAAIEWNKASWNVFDGRKWRTRFGPYPIDKNLRRADWYDDLRDAPARTAYMAPVYATFTIPVQNQRYAGRETRRTLGIRAPAGTSLDSKDAEFCSGGAFSRTESFIGKADWGYCR